MFAISLKSIVVSAAIGLAAVLSAGASANGATATTIPAVHAGMSHAKMQVDYRNNRHQQRPAYRGPACSAKQAVQKASRMGIRKARANVSRNRIVVRGVKNGRPAIVAFAARRGCPIIR